MRGVVVGLLTRVVTVVHRAGSLVGVLRGGSQLARRRYWLRLTVLLVLLVHVVVLRAG